MDVASLLDKSVPLLRKHLEKKIEDLEITLKSVGTSSIDDVFKSDTNFHGLKDFVETMSGGFSEAHDSIEFLEKNSQEKLSAAEARIAELEKGLKMATKANETLATSLKTLSKEVERIGKLANTSTPAATPAPAAALSSSALEERLNKIETWVASVAYQLGIPFKK